MNNNLNLYVTTIYILLQLLLLLLDAVEVSQDKPVVISKFILGAKEVEFDAVARVCVFFILITIAIATATTC